MLGQIEHQRLYLPGEPQVLDPQTRATLMKLITEQMSVLTRDGPITIQEVFGGETFLNLVPAILSAGTLPQWVLVCLGFRQQPANMTLRTDCLLRLQPTCMYLLFLLL